MRIVALLLASIVSVAQATVVDASTRLLSLGGSVTEVIYALSQEHRLVGLDSSSIYPPQVEQLPKVGYYRQVPVEGVVALSPQLILASENAGPKKALQDLAALGVKVHYIVDAPRESAIYERITQIANALGVAEQGQALVAQVKADIAQAQREAGRPLKAVMLINRTGAIMAAGNHTAAHEIMRLAGLQNIFADQNGYKPMSAESLQWLRPDMVIVTEFSAKATGGVEGFAALPALAGTPAVKDKRIVVLDDLLAMGLGPRTGEAVRQLKKASLK